ncbi:MAG: PrgI family protein [Oscillospiraceae bacterium]|nr:PrgI family protein [Oscillospiraceae bacterium]
MEIKIPKEVRQHKETIFFGLTMRQFVCAVLAVGLAVGVYLGLSSLIGQETASWACIVAATPLALAGFFNYNGMTFEQFALAFIKSQFLYAGPRVFRAENIYRKAMTGKGGCDNA